MAQDVDTRRLAVAREALIDDPEFLKAILEPTVQQVLVWEMTEQLQAVRHERTHARLGHRNGYKPRTLKTRVVTLELRITTTARARSRPRSSIATSAARRREWSV